MAGFNTAITGLKAATTDLDVTGNNIANASTVGFKTSRTEFADIYATAVVGAGSSNTAGSGVTVSDIAQDFSAGTIEFTNNNLDLAINGSGFFQLNDGQGGTSYTRAGSFELNKDGEIVSKSGKYLQGYGLDDQGNLLPVGNLAVTQKESPPKATENVDLSFNIDSRADATKLLQPYNKDEPSSYTYSTTVGTYDSLGNQNTIKFNMVEQPPIREQQTITFDDGSGNQVSLDPTADSITLSGVTLNLSDLSSTPPTPDSTSTNTYAQLLAADPRIARVDPVLDSSNNVQSLKVTYNASATDVNDIAVGGISSTTYPSAQVLNIDSANIAANETHTYGVSDTTGLSAATTITIGGVDIPLDPGLTADKVGAAIEAKQGAIQNLNPDVESILYDSTNQTIKVTFKADSGDVTNSILGVSDPSSLLSGPTVVDGDNSYQGVYRMYAYLNGDEQLNIGKTVDPGQPGYSAGQTEVGPILVTFDPTSGTLNSVNGQKFAAGSSVPSVTIEGADPANADTKIKLDLTNTTQFASSSIVKNQQQDGYTKGDLIGVTFSSDGKMVASFSNGQNQSLGVVAISTFENQAGLQPNGDTEWIATLDSGDAITNPPGAGLNGTLRSAALEQSNVDLSSELVKLIQAQRNFQANSKTLETLNTVTQAILQI